MMMWKLVYASVQGTSHRMLRQPCQDHGLGTILPTRRGPVLIAACSDGAGGAVSSAAGSRLACESIIQRAFQAIRKGLPVEKIDRPRMAAWYDAVRKSLSAEGRARGVHVHELACTLLTAVVAEHHAVFSQIGDGAIVTLQNNSYEPIFWPQAGPQAHTTRFVIDPQLAERMEFTSRPATVRAIALFTDGLQQLALNFGTRKARQAFFHKLFQPLQSVAEPESLTLPLRTFLNSPAVNRRTKDDKTLVLACRHTGGKPQP